MGWDGAGQSHVRVTGEAARSEVLFDEELACSFEEEKDFGTRVVNRCGQSSKQEGQQEPGQTG